MKAKPYKKYQPSDVDWLGDVPEQWSTKPIKRLVSTPVTDGPHETPELFDDGIPFVSAEAASEGRINFAKIRGYISQEDHERFCRKYKPQRNDIYIIKSGATTGRIAMVETDKEFSIWSPLAAIRCNPEQSCAKFVFYYFQSKEFQTAIQLSWSFGTQQNIGMGVIQNIAVPCPSVTEQQTIAAYLDRATGKIDAVLAKKRELIERLKEKRTALISAVVTGRRGIDGKPYKAYKPSGVDWLGDVPEHWNVKPIKRIVSTPVTDGPHETPEILDEGMPFVSAEAASEGRINFSKIRGYISLEDHNRFCKKYKPQRNDIYIIKSGATTGRIAMVETDIEFSIWSPLAAIRCHSDQSNAKFVFYYFQSKEFQTTIQLSWSFGTQQNIGMGVIQNIFVPVPPLSEQQAIAAYLDRETSKLDALIGKVETAMERLREYRTALISAVVTGKIDVRNEVKA